MCAIFSLTMSTPATPAAQADRSTPPSVDASAGGFTVRRLPGPITIDGRVWTEVQPIIGETTVRAPNGQFTLTLEESTSVEIVRFRISITEGKGTPVPLDPGDAIFVFITPDSRWIFVDPIDVIDVRDWRRYNLSTLFDVDRFVLVRAISVDGQRLFISSQPCPFDCPNSSNEYYEIGFPAI
jgi:hypothetical protein